MLKIVLLTGTAFVMALTVLAQPLKDTVFYDAVWQQTTKDNARYYRLVEIDTNRIRFFVRDYYVSGELQMEGAYKSINPDFKIGPFTYWYKNNVKRISCWFEQNRLHGLFEEWYGDGKKKTEIPYHHGTIDGTEKIWSETGKLMRTVEYRNGLKNGEFISYYENGRPVRKDIYRNGKLVRGKCFTPEGKDTAYFYYFIMPRISERKNGITSYIADRLIYPDSARTNNEEGLVKIKFTVARDGSIREVNIVQEDKEYFNREAVRVINELPGWIPGRRDGKEVDVTITVPIHFRLK